MESLRGALSIERDRLFVGRHTELAYMRNWLQEPGARTEVVFISGMGGIGKSALLLQLLSMAQAEENVLCIWLDGRNCTRSPAGFLDVIHSYLFQRLHFESTTQAPLTEVTESIMRQRTLLCIDNYDSLNQIQGWLREVFLPELSATELLVVLAAREPLTLDWENDLGWRGRLVHMRLDPLSRVETRKYYANLGFCSTSEVERLIRDTHGHPLAMALAAERLQRTSHSTEFSATAGTTRKAKAAQIPQSILSTQTSPSAQPDQTAWPVGSLVSATLLREVATPELHEVLDILCILPQGNQESLNRLLQIRLTIKQFHQLLQLSFVRPAADGIALHDVARAHLLEDFLRREPQRYEALRRRIVDEACRTLKTAEPHAKGQIAASLMSICRDSLAFHSNLSFSANPYSTAFDLFHTEDLPHLHRLVEEEQFQKATTLASNEQAHELLDVLAKHFPESIRVFRSGDGIPLVFRAGLLLYRETCNFLQSHLPHLLEACYGADAKRMKRLRPDEADTHFHFLGGADHHNPDYTFHELYGYMFTDGFACTLGVGIRLTLTTKNDVLKPAFEALGCRTRLLQNLPPTHPAREDVVHEFDLRSGDFGEWVQSFINGSASGNLVTVDDLKMALALVGDAVALERTVVASWLHCNGEELQHRLQNILSGDFAATKLNHSKQALLQLLCKEPALSSDIAAERLYSSRATYYRRRHEALTEVLKILRTSR